MFVPLDSCTHRTLLLKQGVCLIQQRLQLASPEIKKKKMLIMQRRNHWNELFLLLSLETLGKDSDMAISPSSQDPLYRWLPKFYRSPFPIPCLLPKLKKNTNMPSMLQCFPHVILLLVSGSSFVSSANAAPSYENPRHRWCSGELRGKRIRNANKDLCQWLKAILLKIHKTRLLNCTFFM